MVMVKISPRSEHEAWNSNLRDPFHLRNKSELFVAYVNMYFAELNDTCLIFEMLTVYSANKGLQVTATLQWDRQTDHGCRKVQRTYTSEIRMNLLRRFQGEAERRIK